MKIPVYPGRRKSTAESRQQLLPFLFPHHGDNNHALHATTINLPTTSPPFTSATTGQPRAVGRGITYFDG